jgi:hypothetical protein
MFPKNAMKTKTATGAATAGKMMAQYVFSRPVTRNSSNCGRISTCCGIISPANTSAPIAARPRNLVRDSANPDIEAATTVRMTVSVEMMKLLRYHHPISVEPMTLW